MTGRYADDVEDIVDIHEAPVVKAGRRAGLKSRRAGT